MNTLKQYGFIEPTILKEDYVFGSNLPLEVINPSGNWEEWLPVFEHQAINYETWGCTIYSTLNQVETYFKKVFGFEPNYAERFNYNLVGITPPGASPSLAYESIRKQGVIDEPLLPRPNTLEEFLQPKPMLSGFLKKGLEFLDKYEFKHEWVDSPNPDTIKEALKYSPISVSVTAWIQENGLYVDRGMPNSHWTMAFKVEDGKIHIFDSYDSSIKILHPDHKIKVAKRIHITKRETPLPPKREWWNDFRLFKTWRFVL